jgi:predicted DNA-binding transcriptional regulator AlpA
MANKKEKKQEKTNTELMSAQEFRAYIGISLSAYYVMRSQKILPPHIDLGVKKMLFRREAVDRWLKEREIAE